MDAAIDSVYLRLPLISRRSVRLFKLRPAKPGQESVLEVELYVVELDLATECFTALSYVWGSPHPAAYIDVDTDKLPITQNLYQFLIRLRDEDIGSPLWADAICIDQRSGSEKNHQIPLMSTIYSSAINIRCWLGDTLHDIADCMQAYNDRGDLLWDTEPLRARKSDARGILDRLLQHPYWTRTWIIQEVILAPSVTVHCLRSKLSWDTFVHMTKRLCAKVGFKCLSTFGQSRLMRLHEERSNSEPRTLPDLLQRYRATECLNRRDRVFALVGLINAVDDPLHCTTTQSDDQQATTDLLDYSLSLPTLFIRLWEYYCGKTAETFALNLWEAFDLDHHELPETHLGVQLRMPAHMHSLWEANARKKGKYLPSHKIPDGQRARWVIMGETDLRPVIVEFVSTLPADNVHATRLRIHKPEQQNTTIEAFCYLSVCDMSLVDNKSHAINWIPLSKIAKHAFEGSVFVYRRLADTDQCGCYIEVSMASFKMLRAFFNSPPSIPFVPSKISGPVPSSRLGHRVPTRKEDFQAERRLRGPTPVEDMMHAYIERFVEMNRRTRESDRSHVAELQETAPRLEDSAQRSDHEDLALELARLKSERRKARKATAALTAALRRYNIEPPAGSSVDFFNAISSLSVNNAGTTITLRNGSREKDCEIAAKTSCELAQE